MNLKVEIEQIDGVKRRVAVEVAASDVTSEFDRAYAELARTVSVPGFRRGRVPRSVLERRYATQISADVFERLIRASLAESIEREHLHPLGYPKVTTEVAEAGKPLRYQATVEVHPEVVLGDYAGLRVERPRRAVHDDDVERSLESLRESLGQLHPVADRNVIEPGDVVLVDHEAWRDGKLAGKGTQQQITLGSSGLPAEFVENLVGAKIGDTVEFNAQPSGGESPPTRFKIVVHGISTKELPNLDDEFAKDHGECESLSELRARIRGQLEAEADRRANEAARSALLAKLIDLQQFDVPEALVEAQLEGLVEDVQREWRARGIMPKDAQAAVTHLRNELAGRALAQVKLGLVLRAVAEREKLIVGDEELDARIEEIAERAQQPIERVQAVYATDEQRAHLRGLILEQKAIAAVEERAQFETVDAASSVADDG